MGGHNSIGGAVINLECGSYYVGQIVTGVINISLTKDIDSCELFLAFRGKEKTLWFSGDGKVQYKGNHKICNFHYLLYNWPSGLKAGGYSLPFSFQLPDNIPGSFLYHLPETIWSKKIKANISYYLQCRLITLNKEKIKAKSKITIFRPTKSLITNIVAQKEAKLSTWCCIKQGTCYLKAYIPQDTYNPSHSIHITAEVDNSKSSLNIHDLECELLCSLRLRDNNGNVTYRNSTILDHIERIKISSGDSLLSNSAVELKLNLPSIIHVLQKMYSTSSHLIECAFYIKIEANMDGFFRCCGEHPIVQQAVQIVPDLVYCSPPLIEAPHDWMPQTLDQVNVVYSSEYEVNKNISHS